MEEFLGVVGFFVLVILMILATVSGVGFLRGYRYQHPSKYMEKPLCSYDVCWKAVRVEK